MVSTMTSPGQIFYDSHMHTPLCKHALGEPEEYAEVGKARGLKGIIMTCHSPMPHAFSHAVRMAPSQFDDYVSLVQRATKAFSDTDFEVKLGMESDWFPGMEDWLKDLHQRAEFHYILGSVHYHIPEYREDFWKGDAMEFQRGYFRHLAEAAESGLFDSISHPDLVKNAFPDTWNHAAVEETVIETLDRIQETGVAMELNTSGIHKAIPEMNPGVEMLKLMAERKIPVVLGSDSHQPKRVGAQFDMALDILLNAGYQEVSFFHERRRQSLPIRDVLASLHD
jgi:histidinol-phosphatase (PHP family)